MKKIILTTLFACTLIQFCSSQDIITQKNGEEIKAKVLEVGNLDIKYKKFENPDGPSYSILKSDVLLIKYENGNKDVFNAENLSEQDLFTQGKLDASQYYRNYRPAATGTLIASLVSPLVGLIPAIACSSTQPKDDNLNVPHPELLKKGNYYEGYTKRAKKIKQGKVWKNWGIGLGVNLLAAIILATSAQ